ncbi:MAG TPA: GMC family oxidoreductase [Nocardioides sp.]|uniref:GMC family oxidoreductase n=1 Tax=uncultured Nocardioides sp. TaxID=198441 RepID=UPI000EC23693|nr:GMC family oxidoreductase [uncultured Nocardioides sp.]HCB02690.1 GMC family oxidoreductase [Nocardioides sp.]HRD63557.1 GMC family oxidoreductase [Nocardioides sp.]HRI98154.1 GMC family oxidoreductase [Nocardioides sp.]
MDATTQSPHIADVLVIGAGPSGGMVSHVLSQGGLDVVCLEQGDWVTSSDFPTNRPEWELLVQKRWAHHPNERDVAADYPTEVSESDLSPVMYNAVGGSSLFFGAQWPRLLPSDLKVRSVDGVAADWPLSYDELTRHYDAADQLVGVAGLGGNPAYPDGLDYPLPPHPLGPLGLTAAAGLNRLGWHWWPGTVAIPTARFRELAQCERWGTCEWGCPRGSKASADVAFWVHNLRSGARLVTGARVREILVDSAGRARGAAWVDRDGVEHEQAARAVVVCCNGIGTARLLLNSTSALFPDGLANSSGLVGKNLMLHPCAAVLGVYDEEMKSHRGPLGEAVVSLEFYETRPEHDFVRGIKFSAHPIPGVLSQLEFHRNGPFEQLWGPAIHDVVAGHSRSFCFSGQIDDLPEETNTVTLDPELVDSDGIPAPRIRYRMSDNSRKQLAFLVDRMDEAHRAAGAVRTVRLPLATDQPGHLLGTARMGADPASSVVNPDGRAHDVPNLYIADGSVFVTGGAVNPTATIVALAHRVAQHLLTTARDQEAVA